MEPWIIPIKRLVMSRRTGSWCLLPYHGHKRGCPNYGRKAGCPPMAPAFKDIFNVYKPLYLVHSEFNLRSHISRMRELHPDWSEAQLKCVLYWQPRSRKEMMERVKRALTITGSNTWDSCPEGKGVNVFATAAISGLKLQRTKSIDTCRHITIIGSELIKRIEFENEIPKVRLAGY